MFRRELLQLPVLLPGSGIGGAPVPVPCPGRLQQCQAPACPDVWQRTPARTHRRRNSPRGGTSASPARRLRAGHPPPPCSGSSRRAVPRPCTARVPWRRLEPRARGLRSGLGTPGARGSTAPGSRMTRIGSMAEPYARTGGVQGERCLTEIGSVRGNGEVGGGEPVPVKSYTGV